MKLYGIIGAGGFAREVMPIAEYWLPVWDGIENESELVFVVEDSFYISGQVFNGRRVIKMSDFLSASASERLYNIAIGFQTAFRQIRQSRFLSLHRTTFL